MKLQSAINWISKRKRKERLPVFLRKRQRKSLKPCRGLLSHINAAFFPFPNHESLKKIGKISRSVGSFFFVSVFLSSTSSPSFRSFRGVLGQSVNTVLVFSHPSRFRQSRPDFFCVFEQVIFVPFSQHGYFSRCLFSNLVLTIYFSQGVIMA